MNTSEINNTIVTWAIRFFKYAPDTPAETKYEIISVVKDQRDDFDDDDWPMVCQIINSDDCEKINWKYVHNECLRHLNYM